MNAADWQTLVASPTAGGAYLGIYTHPDDGRQEMVMTLASNQFQSHNQALRHGMLTWVTRGVFLGYQRNYLGLDVDDVFLPDDKWDAAANVTNYDPAQAIRMTPADVDNALAWQQRTGLRLNMVYNMGGVDEFGVPAGNDALLAKFRAGKNQFRWVNHTFQHPNLDCTSEQFTRRQLSENQAQFNVRLGPVGAGLNDPSEDGHGRALRAGQRPPRQPGHDRPADVRRVGAGDGRHAGGRDVRVRDHGAVAGGRDRRIDRDGDARGGRDGGARGLQRRLPRNRLRPVSPAGDRRLGTGRDSARGARDPVDNGTALDVVSITDPAAPARRRPRRPSTGRR